jgi:hypothetical protein
MANFKTGTKTLQLTVLILALTIPSLALGSGQPEKELPGLGPIASSTAADISDGPEPAPSTPPKPTPPLQTRLSLDLGFRSDDLDWNIAGDSNGNNPNILSELTWDDLKINQLRFSAQWEIVGRVYIETNASYGQIYEGENQDSDYLGDDRTLEFSRSNNNADDGHVWDLSFGIGPTFDFGLDYFTTTPLLGLSVHSQKLIMTDGYQTIPATGSFSGLDSSYETLWYGPWIGINLELKAGEPVWLHFGFQYHWASYYAQADWNLRDDFEHPKSFEHETDGTGVVIELGATIFIKKWISVDLAFDYSKWETNEGTDRVFFADGRVGKTQLNRVRWSSRNVSAGVSFHF